MTTTACDDQLGDSTEKHIAMFSIEEILRRNVADLEKELKRQKERAEAANARLRDQIERVTSELERAEAELKSAREQKPVGWMRDDGNLYLSWQKDLCLPEVKFQPLYASPIPAPDVPAPAVPDWNVNIERIRDVMHMLGISIEESVECFSAALPTNINRMTLAMKRHLQELAGMTAATAPNVPNEWRTMLQWLINQRGKAGHCHARPGIWDDDNGMLAGKPCAECAMYDRARAMLQSAEVKK